MGKLRQVAALNRKTFDLLQINGRADGVRALFDHGSGRGIDFDGLTLRSDLEVSGKVCGLRRLRNHAAEDHILKSRFRNRELIVTEFKIDERVGAAVCRDTFADIAGGEILQFQLGARHHAAARINNRHSYGSSVPVLCPRQWKVRDKYGKNTDDGNSKRFRGHSSSYARAQGKT